MVIWKGWLRLFLGRATLNTPFQKPFVQEFSEHGLQITVCESPKVSKIFLTLFDDFDILWRGPFWLAPFAVRWISPRKRVKGRTPSLRVREPTFSEQILALVHWIAPLLGKHLEAQPVCEQGYFRIFCRIGVCFQKLWSSSIVGIASSQKLIPRFLHFRESLSPRVSEHNPGSALVFVAAIGCPYFHVDEPRRVSLTFRARNFQRHNPEMVDSVNRCSNMKSPCQIHSAFAQP